MRRRRTYPAPAARAANCDSRPRCCPFLCALCVCVPMLEIYTCPSQSMGLCYSIEDDLPELPPPRRTQFTPPRPRRLSPAPVMIAPAAPQRPLSPIAPTPSGPPSSSDSWPRAPLVSSSGPPTSHHRVSVQSPSSSSPSRRLVSRAELAEHGSAPSVWVAINGSVYDITSFLTMSVERLFHVCRQSTKLLLPLAALVAMCSQSRHGALQSSRGGVFAISAFRSV